jgi:formylglycine-generating enzyme required for sulfatase activity
MANPMAGCSSRIPSGFLNSVPLNELAFNFYNIRWLVKFFVGRSFSASIVRFIGCLIAGLVCTGNAIAQAPINDNFANRDSLWGSSPSASGSNVNATAETGEPFAAAGRNSVWWQWTAPSSGTAILRTFNSKFDTVVAVYTGSSVSSLTMVGSNDDDATTLQSRLELPVTKGVAYRIQVSSHNGQSGPISLSIAYENTAAPDSITLSKDWMDETASAGVVVATLGSTDPDAGDEPVFSLVLGEGSTDNQSFTVVGNQLRTKSSVLYDQRRTVSIRLRATDRGGLFYERSFSILVVPSAPNAEFVRKSAAFIQQPNYVNAIFQLVGKENRKAINYPKEFFDPASYEKRDLFRAFEAATTTQTATPVSLQESFMQVSKLAQVPAKVRTVLLLDNTRSLSLENLAAIKEAAKQMVDLMFDEQEIAVYSFSGSVNLVAPFTGIKGKDTLKSAIDRITRSTSITTNLYGGIVEMLSLQEWKESFTLAGIETGFLVALTDGEDTSGSASLEDVINLRDDREIPDVVRGLRSIYTVGLGASIDKEVLNGIANAGFYEVEQASELAEKFVEIQRDIIDQANSYYWVNYSSPKRRSNPLGQLRKLELRLLNNTNTDPDGVLSSTFLSDTFTDLESALYINPSADRPAGVSVLEIPRDTVSTAFAFTIYPPLDFSSYIWSIGNPLLAEIVETSDEGDRVVIQPKGRNGTTTLTVTDVISEEVGDFTKEITLIIGTGVNPSTQTIDFAAPADKSPVSLPFQLTGTSSSGLPVSYRVVSGPATIAGNTVTLTGGTGTVTVRASQSGNESYYAAPEVSRSFNVAVDALAGFLSAAGIPADKQGSLDDPDRDGVSNILEYAFNLNPASPAGAMPMTAGGLAGLPRIGVNPNGVPPGFQIEYLRRKGGGLLYTPEISADLKTFTTMPGTPAVSSINTDWERVNLTETSPPAGARRFVRVRVSSTVIPGAPAVTIPPIGTQMHTGKSTTLRMEASGSNLSYQWYRGNAGDTSNPVGTNSSSFTTPALTSTTQYWVRVSNASGSTDSPAAVVTVTEPIIGPVIAVQPASTVIPSESSAVLSVSASGTSPLMYQWYQGAEGDRSKPVGTNSSMLSTPVLTAPTSFWVSINNAAGYADSKAAVISLKPNITIQPQSITISSGQITTLSVAATGPAPLSYQWYLGSSGNTSNPLGTSSNSFTTPALTTNTSYWVRVSNDAGSADSSTTTVSIRPVIVNHPVSATVVGSGQTASLSVTATGPAPLSYQWYQGAVGVTTTPVGTNSAIFTTPALSVNSTYWVRVSNASGSVDSFAATISVRPSITSQPASSSVASGLAATLSVSAIGPAPLNYQWYQGSAGTTSTPVGSNSASFTTPTLTNTGVYWVRVSNAAGSADSSTATITVGPGITVQPVSTTISSGQSASLTVSAQGSAPLTYQWYQGAVGTTTTPVGTNSPGFTTSALSSHASYWVRVSNAAGNISSTGATVSVRPSITTQPVSTTIISGQQATLAVAAAGPGPFTYQWYQGNQGSTTTPVGTNSASFTTPTLSSNTPYWVRVSNSAGSVDSSSAIISVIFPPVITSQPVSTTIGSGNTPTLSVAVSGTGPLAYQWYQGAVGETTKPVGTNAATFTTPVLTTTTTYWVRVSNSAAVIDSDLATLSVVSFPDLSYIPAGPFQMGVTSGDTDADAPSVEVTVSAFLIGKTEVTKALWDDVRTWAIAKGYTDLATGSGKAADNPVHNVNWWDVIKWCNARSEREGLTPCYTVSGMIMRTGTTAPTVSWSANGYRLPTEAEWEKAARGGVSGRRFPWGASISHSEANYLASTSYSYNRSGSGYHPEYSTGTATQPFTSPVGRFAANGYGLYDMAGNVSEWCWDWYGPSSYINGVKDPRGAISGVSRVRRGGSWSEFPNHCRAAGRYFSDLSWSFFDLGLRAGRSAESGGIFPPSISVQPAATTLYNGSSVTLTVSAGGLTPLNYQWYQGSVGTVTTPVGSNSASLITPALSSTTTYWVRVSNAAGTVDSALATVITPPLIASHPVSTTITSNNKATLEVGATGTGPLTYQWYQGSLGVTTNPVGTGNPTFTTPSLTSTTSYWVKVSNAAGSVNSTSATVTVVLPPSITTQPSSQTIINGGTATLTVEASGGAPISYQWFHGFLGVTTNPVGGNSASFTTPALTTSTYYWVRVSNSAGTSVSSVQVAISVISPPSITTQPSSTTIVGGSAATLTVFSTSMAAQTYQWYQGAVGNTSNPVGAAFSSFTTPALSETTGYWVRVSNSVGSTDSVAVIVTVLPEMAFVPAGSFTMGRTSGDSDSDAPPVTVTTGAFQMGRTEVTAALWNKVRDWAMLNGYSLRSGSGGGNNPIREVSWFDAVAWSNARSEMEGLVPCYTINGVVMRSGIGSAVPVANWSANGYRLPTEAEWEKAARGGLGGKRFPWGTDAISHSQSVFLNAGGESYASGTTGYHPSYGTIAPVASLPPNGYGLYDMAGNANEWCWDWRDSSAYVNGAIDPKGPTTGTGWRVCRGGSGESYAISCRASNRGSYPPDYTYSWVAAGFRIVRQAVAPGITVQPASMSIVLGNSASLSVSVNGTGPFTYQWYQGPVGNTTTPVGVNSPTFNSPALTDTTSFWIRISNIAGSVNSALATVTVVTPPAIITQPGSATINSGLSATLTVVASGTNPVYQWYQGAVGTTTNPVGTNSATLTTPTLSVTTSYWVRVSNLAGSVDSLLATVTVIPADLALIPLGSFTMGRTSGDTDSNAPPVTVTVSTFYMGKKEVTKAEWDDVRTWGLANGYSDLSVGAGKASNHPVQTVSWWDVVKWCNARSQKEGLTPCYTLSGAVMKTGTIEPAVNWSANGYRLPTEAEWEKAARGGVSGKRFPWGTDTISHSQANFWNGGGEPFAAGTTGYQPTYATGTEPYTSPVGSFAVNGYGLYDMAGNVREWCWDWYGASTYVNGSTDPRGAASGTYRVDRGGGWSGNAIGCRAAHRRNSTPTVTNSLIGFRVARSSVP